MKATLALARQEVPRDRLALGVPSYAYAWPKGRPAVDDLSVAAARRMTAGPGWWHRWDRVQGEQHAWNTKGDQVWWDDARSVALRVDLARKAGLRGAAVWRLGGGDTLPSTRLGAVERPAVRFTGARQVVFAPVRGLVALTFDDGPDPQCTPAILDVLRREQVPATFFDVGTQAQAHPDLVRCEIAEGHVVGNHTFSHLDAAQVPEWRQRLEIMADQWVLHHRADAAAVPLPLRRQRHRPGGGPPGAAPAGDAAGTAPGGLDCGPGGLAAPGRAAHPRRGHLATLRPTAPSSCCTTLAVTARRRWCPPCR